MKLDAISITSKNLKETAKFYQLLGFTFPDFTDAEKHLEPITEDGKVRLMIDSVDLMMSIYGVMPTPPTHPAFGMLCVSPAEVDEAASKIKDAGYTVVKDPYDAFWGQRYATVQDPDGYMVDIFAAM